MSEETELYLATESVGTATLFFGGEPVWDEPPGKWCYGPKSIECWVLSTRPQAAPAPGAPPVKVKLMPAEPTEQDEALIIQRSCGAEAVELLRATEPGSSIGPVTWWNRLEDILSRHDDAKGTVADGRP